ncbi:hypothetical protein C8J57DRAFT_1337604, partial [Mycena rebaudengoi]
MDARSSSNVQCSHAHHTDTTAPLQECSGFERRRATPQVPAPSHHAHLPTEPQITHPRSVGNRATEGSGQPAPIYIVSRYPLLARKPIHSGPSSHADYTTRTRATRPRTEEQQPAPAACQNESPTHHAAQNQGRPRPAQETSPPHILKVPRTHIDSTYHSPLPTYARRTPGS